MDGDGSPNGRIPADYDPEVPSVVVRECSIPGGGTPAAVASGIGVRVMVSDRRGDVSGGCPTVERAGDVNVSSVDSTTSECCWWEDGCGSPNGRIPAGCGPEV